MACVLIVGIDPDAVDYDDPALPPGLTAEVVRRGIALGLEQLCAAGHEALHLDISADPSQLNALAAALATVSIDCVAIGGGVRIPPRNLALFEALINVVARAEKPPAIALPGRPEELAAAVARVLG